MTFFGEIVKKANTAWAISTTDFGAIPSLSTYAQFFEL